MIPLPLPWIRIALIVGACLAIAAGGAAVRSHLIGVGEARVQAKWDKQKQADADQALVLAQAAARDQAVRDRNAERTADEDHRREQARLDHLAAAERTARGLRDAIAKLDADDLSAAAADPRVAAIAQRAATARGLLGECSDRRLDLAGKAQRLRDQVAGLRDFALTTCRAGAADPANTHNEGALQANPAKESQ